MGVRKQAWPQGTPAWVDLMAKDFDKTKEFYGGLFGWEFSEGTEEFGNYSTATLNGAAVAGISPTPPGMEEQPSVWTTYLAVDDLEGVSAAVTEAGGSVIMPAMQIGDFGGMALVSDPTGAAFGLWQSGTHTGVGIFAEPGALVWNEVMVGDFAEASRFYADVFGYTYTDIGGGAAYSTVELDGKTVGGIGDVELAGEDVPPHWRTYFAVEDAAAACAKAVELGGSVVAEPWDTAFGTMAAVKGPSGEVFLLNQAPAADPDVAEPSESG